VGADIRSELVQWHHPRPVLTLLLRVTGHSSARSPAFRVDRAATASSRPPGCRIAGALQQSARIRNGTSRERSG